jgi:hypothetical protein
MTAEPGLAGVISSEVLMVKKLMTILLFIFLLPPVCRGQERNGPEDRLRQAQVLLDRTESYTGVLHKQERVKWLLLLSEHYQPRCREEGPDPCPGFDWEDRLIEGYGYEDLTLDAGLTDADFDPRNPKYEF